MECDFHQGMKKKILSSILIWTSEIYNVFSNTYGSVAISLDRIIASTVLEVKYGIARILLYSKSYDYVAIYCGIIKDSIILQANVIPGLRRKFSVY